ncbi:MAG TPA: NAD-dependent epimerase/dehydratase family protein [Thermoguttaceae bacterium]|nr:NAD-dependent epimerase/dehydratase family protein [Thermoguttaceae bacterium]
MAKVLVTGASGFVGSHLAAALCRQGDEVTCLVRKTSVVDRLRPLGLRLVYGSVTEPDSLQAAVAGNEIVYHVAGSTKAFRKEHLFKVNEQGTANVARACAEQTTPPVLVVVSSLAAAGPAPDGQPRTEADPAEPVSNYGRSKLAGERAAEQFADRLPITIVRPPIVVGEADRDGFAMFRAISRFRIHLVPTFRPRRYSLIHAADLANLLILAARRGTRLSSGPTDGPSPPGHYFAACEVHPTYAQLGRMVAAALGRRRVLVLPANPLAVRMAATLSEVCSRIVRRPNILNFDKVREIRAGSWLCSAQAATDELGYSPAAPLPERLRQTAEWYRREGWL